MPSRDSLAGKAAVTNNSTSAWTLPDGTSIAGGATVDISDRVWDDIPASAKGAGKLTAVVSQEADQLGLSVVTADGRLLTRAAGDGIANTLSASGATAATPIAGTAIATIADPADGVYRVRVVALQVGTVDANRLNINLRTGATVVSALLSIASAMEHIFERVTLSGTDTINAVVGAAAGGVGAIYVATIQATRVE